MAVRERGFNLFLDKDDPREIFWENYVKDKTKKGSRKAEKEGKRIDRKEMKGGR